MGFTALIAGGLGAAGSIGSALIGSNAASKASQAQVGLGEQALASQRGMFNQGLQQQLGMFGTAQGALQPFISAGQSVLPTLQGLITPGANQNALLAQTPGFQFASQYGTMAAKNALSAQGLGASAGPLATAVSQYNNGLAQNTWGSVVGALQNYAGLGGNAANTLAGAATNAGNSILSNSVGAGNAQAGTLGNIGSSTAAGILGSANALSGGITGVTGSLGNALTTGALFNALGGQGLGGGGLYGNGASAGPITLGGPQGPVPFT